MLNILPFVVILALLAAVVTLLGAVFGKKNRKRRLGYSLISFVVLVAASTMFAMLLEEEAEAEGFTSVSERAEAHREGITDAEVWKAKREEKAARTDEALKPLVNLVDEVTKGIPGSFEQYGPVLPYEKLMEPLPQDVMAYARFYWTVDQIEGNCRFLGQRSNIEMLDPDTGVSAWVGTVELRPEHPSRAEWKAVYDTVSGAVETLGEDVVCPEMYRMLGPNGTLMGDAVKINALIDPAIFDRYEVRQDDGVLWSKRDYCDRRYFLQPPEQQDMHDLACQEAKEQGF